MIPLSTSAVWTIL